ncbi:MAG: magnesium chelatase [Dehalococcoidia bacterium]|nr:MAG: magnesium chelatase [Dehalococcoidia bacterium]
MTRAPLYPFSAVVGQEQMRLALLLNAVSPLIGGVLIRGEKGTAKSTVARALAALLPEQPVVVGCPFGCAPPELCGEHASAQQRGEALSLTSRPVPVVELPSNATEDRLAGTLDLSAALQEGKKRFEPGLLAAANRGILYVDEVNLLSDHLVDLLLDAAAMGVHTVEREGVSFQHPARFLLIGTMNPEEGELRPQLLDRFGLCVEVRGLASVEERVEVMRRRAAFEADPVGFAAQWATEEQRLRDQIMRAHTLLPHVQVEETLLRLIATIALELGVDGHRADLVVLRTARALAAYEGRLAVTPADVRRAAELALPHRLRRRPFEEPREHAERLQEMLERHCPTGSVPPPDEHVPGPLPDPPLPPAERSRREGRDDQPPAPPSLPPTSAPPDRPATIGSPLALPDLPLVRDRQPRASAGRREQSLTSEARGRVVRAAFPHQPTDDLALAATIRAAAAHPPAPGAALAVSVEPEDLRQNVRQRKVGAEILFVVDASGSMGAQRRMEAAKGAVLTLLTEAYQRRDRVGMVVFRGQGAELLLPFTASVEVAHRQLRALPTGGRTPLAAGIAQALQLVQQPHPRAKRAYRVVVLITDGRANVPLADGSPVEDALHLARQLGESGVTTLVLDPESGFPSFGLARQLAEAARATYVRLADLSAEAIAARVRQLC